MLSMTFETDILPVITDSTEFLPPWRLRLGVNSSNSSTSCLDTQGWKRRKCQIHICMFIIRYVVCNPHQWLIHLTVMKSSDFAHSSEQAAGDDCALSLKTEWIWDAFRTMYLDNMRGLLSHKIHIYCWLTRWPQCLRFNWIVTQRFKDHFHAQEEVQWGQCSRAVWGQVADTLIFSL